MSATSSTLALVRKDRLWLSVFLLVGASTSALLCSSYGFESLFVLPSAWAFRDLSVLLGIPAALLALFQAVREPLAHTEQHLLHRPVTRGRVLWSRVLAGTAIVLAWLVAGIAKVWLRDLFIGGGCTHVDPRGWHAMAAVATDLVLVYALTCAALALPVAWFARALAWVVAMATWQTTRSAALAFEPSWSVFVAGELALAVLVLFVARRAESVEPDRDRPVPSRALRAPAILGAVMVALLGALLTSSGQFLALTYVCIGRPWIVRVAPDELALVSPRGEHGRYPILDSDLDPSGRWTELGGDVRIEPAPRPREPELVPGNYSFAGRVRMRESSSGRSVEFLPSTGEVRVVQPHWGADLPRDSWMLAPQGVGRLSEESFLWSVHFGLNEADLLLVDPGAGVWRVTTATPPALEPTPLPDGDIPVRLASSESGFDALLGARAAWERAPHGWIERDLDLFAPRVHRDVLDADALRPTLEVRLKDGPSLRHRYGLTTTREKTCAVLAALGSVLRPAPSALASAGLDYDAIARTRPDQILWLLDPLLGGGYAWLVWPNLVLTALLAAHAWRVLRRRGASTRRTLAWTLAVLAAGAFAWLLLHAFEPRRAWRRPPKGAEAAVLIRAA